jgi:two-component system NtrC family sensor kinase
MKLALRITPVTAAVVCAVLVYHGYLGAHQRSAVETAILTAASALLLFFLIYLLVGKPIGKLVQASRQISQGDFSTLPGFSRKDEISELAVEIGTMAKQLQIANERAEHETAARLATLEQLRHIDRLKTVGQLTSGVVHEIGTPLTVILGRARMIQRGEATGDEAKDCARVAVEQTEKVTKTVRQILDFARRESDKERPPKDLSEMAGNMVRLLSPVAVRSGIYLEHEKTDAPTVARVDLSQIQQALANLVMNAIQATKSGGRVVVGISREIMRHPRRSQEKPRLYLTLFVKDEGEGIPHDMTDKIFEPFFTTKASGQGTGLGLAISKEIVRDHGGWISVDSDAEEGSCFSIHLPAEEEQE